MNEKLPGAEPSEEGVVSEAKESFFKKYNMKRWILLFLVLCLSIYLWCAPPEIFGINGLTVIQQRVIAIFVFSAFMWLFEIIPSWATSVILITILLLTTSDSQIAFFNHAGSTQELGTLIKSKDIMASFADPVIMLFLGGFVLAIAATKVGLDAMLARALLKPFGHKSEFVLLGFLLITGMFSMFISNTATAAMMFTFLTPVFKALPPGGKGRIALTMAIPIGANIGGMGTPIGTPPNAIALKFLNDVNGFNLNVGFGEWVSYMFPYILVLLLLSWFFLVKLFPFKQKTISIDIPNKTKRDTKALIVYIVFAITVLMWMFDKFTGVNANVVAMIPVAVFCATGVITSKDLGLINWSIIWLVAGGFALGLALTDSGLADGLIHSIPFGSWSPILVLIVSGLICWTLSNFISNTATAALLIPILSVVGASMSDTLPSVGGAKALIIGIAMSASCAMLMPISTPPNALAHATGLVEQKDMMRIGIIVGVLGMTIGYGMLYILGINGLL